MRRKALADTQEKAMRRFGRLNGLAAVAALCLPLFADARGGMAAPQGCPANAHVVRTEVNGNVRTVHCGCDAGYRNVGGACVIQDAGTDCKSDPSSPFFGIKVEPDTANVDCDGLSRAFPRPGGHSPPAKLKSHAVNCDEHSGEVKAHATDLPDLKNAIVLSYEGERAEDFHWVQILWREKLATIRNANGSISRDQPISGFYAPNGLGGECRQFTTDRNKPHYFVDAARPGLSDRSENPDALPNYESTFRHFRNSRLAAMMDAPGPVTGPRVSPGCGSGSKPAGADWRPNTISIKSTAHFDSFLVGPSGKVCAKASWQVSYVWTGGLTSPRISPPQYELSDLDVSGAPPNAEQLSKLNYSHPGQETLRP
jgi:hypothetical protein